MQFMSRTSLITGYDKNYLFIRLQKSEVLITKDARGMTPLHCSAMFDHPDLVRFLVLEVKYFLHLRSWLIYNTL